MTATLTQTAPARPATAATGGFAPGHRLSGRQKAAIIVRFLLSHGADLPLTHLTDDLQAMLTEQIGQMDMIDRATLETVVEEFCSAIERVGLSFPAGVDGALRMLDGRISATAANRLKRLSGMGAKADPWDKIRSFDATLILPALREESIEIGAVILSKLTVPTAADLLGKLPGDRARRIAYAMSQTGNIDPEAVRRIGQSLVSQLDHVPVRAFEDDPAERVGQILNVSLASTRDDVLQGLADTDAAVAEQVRKVIFIFAHIPSRIQPRDVPKILRGIEQDTLVKAIAGAQGENAATAEFLLANMSQRLATNLREEVAALGKVRDRDAEAAQAAIVAAIRDLQLAGDLEMIMPEETE